MSSITSKIKYLITVEWYNFFYLILNRKHKFIPKIATVEETIDKIKKDKCSVSRFGDGEILLTNPAKNIGFQRGNQLLSERLKEVLTIERSNHIVCISDVFEHLERYNRKARRFWRTNFFLYDKYWFKYLNKERQYYNTFMSRPYMDFASKEKSGLWFRELQEIWDNRDIVFIEGAKSRLGVGNDLFSNAKTIRRILAPATNAFDCYDRIIAAAQKVEKSALILIALGPTATVLAYDLSASGYQAIDIGHADIEYEWWKMKATRKVKLNNKFVNEAGGDNVTVTPDQSYYSQILFDLSNCVKS